MLVYFYSFLLTLDNVDIIVELLLGIPSFDEVGLSNNNFCFVFC